MKNINPTHLQLGKFPNVNGMRALAFLKIFIGHAFISLFLSSGVNDTLLGKMLRPIITPGLGVSAFFVLSGFLTTYSILYEISVKGELNLRNYYRRRIIRIWPLYFFFISIVFLLLYLNKESFSNTGKPLYYYLFLSNFDVINQIRSGIIVHPILGITWSLAVQEQLLLLWPLLFYYTSQKFYIIIFSFVVAASVMFRFYFFDDNIILYFHSFSLFYNIAIGGLFAYFIITFERFKTSIEKLSKKAILFSYLLIVLWFILGGHLLHSTNISRLSILLGPINAIAISFLILEQNYCHHSFFKLSHSKLLSNLGKYPLGLYLLQAPASIIMQFIFTTIFFPFNESFLFTTIVCILGILFTFFLSYLSYHLLEGKVSKVLDRYSFKNLSYTLHKSSLNIKESLPVKQN